MKVIDLLNKIANGEEVPKKYRYKNMEYKEDYCYMLYEATGDCNELGFKSLLNDEVEIIEEDKKIENIKDLNTDYYDKNETYDYLGNKEIALDILTLKHKINEIIDYINKEE